MSASLASPGTVGRVDWRSRGRASGYAAAVAVGCLLIAPLAGCGSTGSASDAAVKRSLLRGVAEIHGSQNGKALRGKLVRTLARIRHERGSTAVGRKARGLAIQGFTWTLKGIDSQLDLLRNDSGRLEGAVRDAERADRYRNRGAALLRASGRALNVRIGTLKGH